MPDQNYFIRSGTDQSGPFSGQQLKQFVTQGRLKPNDFIRQDGSDKWHQAGQVPGLFPAVTPPPIEPPPLPPMVPPLPIQPQVANTAPALPSISHRPSTQKRAGMLVKLWVGAGALALIVAVVVAVAFLPNKEKAILSRDEFRTAVIGKTTTEVEAAIGKPAKQTEAFGDFFWFYHGRSLDPATGKPDLDDTIRFQHDRATELSFVSANGNESTSTQPPQQTATTPSNSPISDDDFRRLVFGKTHAEVISAVGEPEPENKHSRANDDWWMYEIVGTGKDRPDNTKHFAYVYFLGSSAESVGGFSVR